jgi:hypothetical protein
MPTDWPFTRANPQMMLFAQCGKYSKKSPSSTTSCTTFFMSYGWLGDGGRISRSVSHSRVGSSAVSTRGASSRLFEGRKLRR